MCQSCPNGSAGALGGQPNRSTQPRSTDLGTSLAEMPIRGYNIAEPHATGRRRSARGAICLSDRAAVADYGTNGEVLAIFGLLGGVESVLISPAVLLIFGGGRPRNEQ